MIPLEPGPVEPGKQGDRKEYIWMWIHGWMRNLGEPIKSFFQ